MIRFCFNPVCGRGFISLIKLPRQMPMLCPTCRKGMAPLSRLVGGKDKPEKVKSA